MKKHSALIALLCALPLAVACSKKEEPAPHGEAAPPAAPAPAEPEAPLPALAPDMPVTELGDLPTPEDLEEEAEKTIAVDNLEVELDRLEAEIVGYE